MNIITKGGKYYHEVNPDSLYGKTWCGKQYKYHGKAIYIFSPPPGCYVFCPECEKKRKEATGVDIMKELRDRFYGKRTKKGEFPDLYVKRMQQLIEKEEKINLLEIEHIKFAELSLAKISNLAQEVKGIEDSLRHRLLNRWESVELDFSNGPINASAPIV